MRKGSRVSPEHSEDGNIPPIADTVLLQTSIRIGTAPPASVPDPLSRSVSDVFHSTEKPPTKRSIETTSSNLPGAGFLIDEKELADAVFKAMEAPVQAVVPVSPVEKKTTKRRRIDAAVTTAVQSVTNHPVSSVEGKMPLSPEPVKASRRKDCPEEHERRRERNRVLARKSRQKKKNLFETLQKEVARLNHQNQIMREIITTKMGVGDLDRILEQYGPPADDESVDHTTEAASVSGSDSD